jgi:hypothetical protein
MRVVARYPYRRVGESSCPALVPASLPACRLLACLRRCTAVALNLVTAEEWKTAIYGRLAINGLRRV